MSFSALAVKGPSQPFPVQQPAAFVGMSPMAGVYTGSVPVQPGQYDTYAVPAGYSSAASQQALAAQPIPTGNQSQIVQ